MKRELALNTFACNNTPDHKHFASARTALRNYDATKNLDAFFDAFLNLGVNVYRIADAKRIDFLPEGGLLNQLENLLAHDLIDTIKWRYRIRMVGGGQYGDGLWPNWKGQIRRKSLLGNHGS